MTDRLDLPRRYREQLEALLREHVPDVEVWAYGSRVNGKGHEASDLDIVLRGPALEPLGDGFFDLLEAIENSNIPILVQAHDWAKLPESFHHEVERDYVVVQETASRRTAGRWRRVALGDLIDLRLSSVDKKSKANEQAVQLCNYTDVYNNSFIHAGLDFMAATATDREIAKCSLVAGDVVITKDSEKHDDIGVPALVREDVPNLVCGYHLAILRPRVPVVDGTYLFYALSADETQQQFHSYANGITRFGLRKFDIGLVEINVPPLPEQRAIAHVLGTLDDKIELNRRMNETLEEMARALFKSWFVDFEPVRAKMEGRWRRGESLPGLPAEQYDLFPDRLVASELGEIPEGWEVKPLGDVIEVERGLSYKGSGLSSSGVPMHNLNSIYEGGGYKNDGIKHYTGDYQPRHLTQPGDVIVANTEQGHDRLLIGFAAIVPNRFGAEGLFSHHIYRVHPRSSFALTPDYICQMLNTEAMHDIVSGYATGTTVNMLPVDALRIPPTAIPPSHIVTTFSTFAEEARTRREKFSAESQLLDALLDGLLPKLVSGKVGVGEREADC